MPANLSALFEAPVVHEAQPEGELVPTWLHTAVRRFVAGAPIEDWTARTPKELRKKRPGGTKVDALVLHQMAFRGRNAERYRTVKAHFAITPEGRILQLHPISALLWSSNGFNDRSVAVEFAGNFPNIRGRCWQPKDGNHGCHALTQAQIAAGRRLVRHLIDTIGLTHIFAHRQSTSTRKDNCPGPDIWYYVGQWAVENLGLNDGGPGYKIGQGMALPAEWRNWGRSRP